MVNKILIVLMLIILASCSGNKYLTENQAYYNGATVKYDPPKNIERSADVQDEISDLLRPEPNSRLLGSRPRVWFYQIAGDLKKDKGFRYWVKNKLGRKPVLMQDLDAERTRGLIETSLNNNGYFDASVSYKIKNKKHSGRVSYKASIGLPYRYDTINYEIDDEKLQRIVSGLRNESNIKKGDRYDLGKLRGERARIEKAVKDLGFYHFDDEYLLFKADSTVGDRQVEMFLQLKSTTPGQAKRVFNIEEVNLFTNYSFETESELQNEDTVTVDGVNFIRSSREFRPEILAEQVVLAPNQTYSKERELITLNRLIQLDVFQYVNIDYEESASDSLSANIYLTPYKKKSLRLELQAVSKSNDFVGPNFNATFQNRNIFGGAESYELKLDAGYEVQVGGNRDQNNQALNSYTIGLENVLTIPRIISPLNIRNRSSRFIPQTKFKLGFRTLQRINFFRLNSVNLAYGFDWQETRTKRHELYPIDIDFIQLGQVSDEFDSVLNDNPFLRRSYEEQFILGTTYSFYYNTQNDDDRISRSDFYFNFNTDLSGNLMHLTQSSIRSEENTDEDPYELLGSPYSQFVKADIDFRHYFKLNAKNTIASRLVLGAGYAFGNSTTMPYTKQFAIGGSTSLRAFRARSIGPGRYQLPDNVTFIDQTADIKFETNFEYRFPIIGAFKGATFIDAGNIWTIRTDEQRPGSKFEASKFLSQLAVGTGAGIRFDAQFFVLRLDLAFPIRIPSREKGDRWVLKDIAFQDSGWRSDNLLLNIAIGYPF